MATKETYNPNYINKNFPLTLHSTVVTLCTTKNSLLCPQSAFVRSVYVLQNTSVIFVCGISQVVCSLRGTNWMLTATVKKIKFSLFASSSRVGGVKVQPHSFSTIGTISRRVATFTLRLLYPRKGCTLVFVQKAWRTPESVRRFWRRKQSLRPTRIRTPGRPTR